MTMWLDGSVEIEQDFPRIWRRFNKHTKMKGCKTPKDIRRRMDKTIRGYDLALKSGYLDSEKSIRKFQNAKKNLKKLKKSDFPETAVARAIRHPAGIENLTFQYGYEKAREIMLAKRRSLRRRKRRRRFR